MIYLDLFWSFFQVGLLSFGGGYASIPLIQQQTVNIHNWITLTEFTDLITISQMTPGPVAINSATFVGIKIAGIGGALAATAGCILPSCIIVMILAVLYNKFKKSDIIQSVLVTLRPAVIALIASAGITILILSLWSENNNDLNLTDINYISVGIFVTALIILRKFKPNPIIIMAASGGAGIILYLLL